MSLPTDPTVQWLRDVALLQQLPQRYSRAVDERDFDALAALFTSDAVVDGARGAMTVTDWLDGLRNGPRMFESGMHVLGEPLIDVEPGADTARSDTYAVVYQLRAPDAAEGDLVLGIRYLDDLLRDRDGWVIRHRTARTLWNRNTR